MGMACLLPFRGWSSTDPVWCCAENQVIKLPANKYTVREREMMSAIGVPSEFFKTGNNLPKFAFGGECLFHLLAFKMSTLECSPGYWNSMVRFADF